MDDTAKAFSGLAILLLLILWCCGSCIGTVSNQADMTATVIKAERINNRSNNGSRYLVFTKDVKSLSGDSSATEEVFEDTDEWVFGKFNSSDLYGSLTPGTRYQFHVSGVRNQMFSWYRNIIKAEEVK